MRAALAMALLLGLGGCLRSTEFHCIDSTQCGGGVCQSVGFCSFSDSGCPSGQRFGDSAGTYAGQCAGGGGEDGGVDDAPLDDAAIDAPVDMASATCPASYAPVTGGQANHVYRLINTAAIWDTQRTACAADGANAYLAIPDDAAELQAINGLVPAGDDWWIGVGDAATEGMYVNVKGAAQTFLPWDTGQPNNINNADCVEVHQSNRTWNDTACSTPSRALCECEL